VRRHAPLTAPWGKTEMERPLKDELLARPVRKTRSVALLFACRVSQSVPNHKLSSQCRLWYTCLRQSPTHEAAIDTIACMQRRQFNAPKGLGQSDHILRIAVSPMYFSRPSSKCSHHSKSMVLQISLNQGVNLSAGSWNNSFNPSAVTYLVSWTSFGFGSRSTSALMKRM
jgi:hypothetical protein